MEEPVQLVVEGMLDEIVLRRVLESLDLACGPVYGKRGKDAILKSLSRYNHAARYAPWVVVVDLDQYYACAPELVEKHLPTPARGMRLRVAVRAIESWLLADPESLGPFLGVSKTKFPHNPDMLDNPKRELLSIVRKFGRKARIKDDLLPKSSGASVGKGYNVCLMTFVQEHWKPQDAVARSDSLQRAMIALESLKDWRR